MTCQLRALCWDAHDPVRLARFLGSILGRELAENAADDDADAGAALAPKDDTGFRIRFQPTQEPKTGPNQMHLHLTSTSLQDQEQTVTRALALGARHIDVGQRPEEGHVVLADPEDNEFCVIEPGNSFLTDCGFLGELACDGTREVGHFWSRALDWPLVWDQEEETAIRAPYGGPKLTWGGPPLKPKTGKERVHLDLAPPAGGDLQTEVDRLVTLGATHVDIGQTDPGWVVLADPDGHEFCLRG